MKRIVPLILIYLLSAGWFAGQGFSASFKVASYNVENLFDLHPDGTEYPDYVPGGLLGWDNTRLEIKLENIASVINDLDADIIALQEVESKKALSLLIEHLALMGTEYRYFEIAEKRLTSVKCAVLSKFPITAKEDICAGNENQRNILKVQIDINGSPLFLYVNHWKSKSGPESKRLTYAAALASDISEQACDADYILIGDFNSDYNEYETFKQISRFNDTRGITGINHIVNTVKGSEMVGEAILTTQKGCGYVYNLWLEIPESRRWSVNFFGRKNSPDSMIVSKSLYDSTGISYVDNSFDKFDPDYLFDNNKVFRWQRAARGKGRHLGKGYSDHLPIFARFSTQPFCFARQQNSIVSEPAVMTIKDLYNLEAGPVNVCIHEGVVIFKECDNAVIKQKDGRSIYIYKAAKELKYAMAYNLTVTHLKRHYGNLEITGIRDIEVIDRENDMKKYRITSTPPDLADPQLQNEVVGKVSGIYENGWFHYEGDQKIKLYFANPALQPEDFSMITLSHVRIGYHMHPEIIVERVDQIRKQ